MSRLLPTLATVALLAGLAPGQSLTLADVFPTDRVIDVQITVAKQDWRKLRLQSRNFATALDGRRKKGEFFKPYTYFDADVVIDGVKFLRVGIRKKGFIGSLSLTRPSLKIKLNHTDATGSIGGLTNLTLNNNQQDRSLASQFLAYQLFNAAGSPASRCAHARVTVNGKYLGVYSHVETARHTLLERGFGSADGTLYEGTVVDFFEGWDKGFERKLGNDEAGREKIRRLIEVLKDEQTTDKAVAEFVDLDAFYTFWALEGLLGCWDGYTSNKNNYFFYLHPKTGLFHFMPWGADALFVEYGPFGRRRGAPISVKTQGLVAHRLYQLETGRRRYRETMKRLLESVWNEKAILKELDRMEELLEPHLGPTQRRAVDQLYELREFVENRRANIMAEIKDGMPVWDRRPDRPFVMPGADEAASDSIWTAARTGDVRALRRHVRKGADVNAANDVDGARPLGIAAVCGHTTAVRYLLGAGAAVNATNDKEHSALHGAAFLGHLEVIALLIENKADLDLVDNDGSTPLDSAAAEWNDEIAGFVGFIGTLLQIEFDLEEVKANRPKAAALLRKHGARRGLDLKK